jgi:hypothetical protein
MERVQIKKVVLLLAATLLMTFPALAQTVSEDDIKDFDSLTGTGCSQRDPVTKKADFYFVCKSKASGEGAWNAALYRAKLACGKDKFNVFFNIPPSLPKENGIYGAQIEVSCGTKP